MTFAPTLLQERVQPWMPLSRPSMGEDAFARLVVRREHWNDREPVGSMGRDEVQQNIVFEQVSTVSEVLILHNLRDSKIRTDYGAVALG